MCLHFTELDRQIVDVVLDLLLALLRLGVLIREQYPANQRVIAGRCVFK